MHACVPKAFRKQQSDLANNPAHLRNCSLLWILRMPPFITSELHSLQQVIDSCQANTERGASQDVQPLSRAGTAPKISVHMPLQCMMPILIA